MALPVSWASHLINPKKTSIQYKADAIAQLTGNAFVEICSVRRDGRCEVEGWAYTCAAEWLLYLVKGGALYICPMATLRHQVTNWCNLYPIKSVPNDGYTTEGLIVPLSEFERVAKIVLPEFEGY